MVTPPDPMFGAASPFVRVGWEPPRRSFRLLLSPARRACVDLMGRASAPLALAVAGAFVWLVGHATRGWSGWVAGAMGGFFAFLLVAAALVGLADAVARRGVDALFRTHGAGDMAWRRGIVRAIDTFSVPTAPERQAVLWLIDGAWAPVQVSLDFLLHDRGDPIPTVVEMQDAILVEDGGDKVAPLADAVWAWLTDRIGDDFLQERDAPAVQIVVAPGDEVELLGVSGRTPNARGDVRRLREPPTGPSLGGTSLRPLLLRRIRA